MTNQPQTELDEILHIELKDYGTKVLKLIDVNEAKAAILDWHNKQMKDPFDYIEPCKPDCSEERHAYHQGQWDMAHRMADLGLTSKESE